MCSQILENSGKFWQSPFPPLQSCILLPCTPVIFTLPSPLYPHPVEFHFLFPFFISFYDELIRILLLIWDSFPNTEVVLILLQDKILQLTAEDGPNIPLRTLAIYCGTTHSTLSKFARRKSGIGDELRAQVEQGLREYLQEIQDIIGD